MLTGYTGLPHLLITVQHLPAPLFLQAVFWFCCRHHFVLDVIVGQVAFQQFLRFNWVFCKRNIEQNMTFSCRVCTWVYDLLNARQK
ncbi:hypothetical protein ASD15_08855 [Massilia sp. Root351]|nr:hypothetical protein ASD15_08855 [Massilia sp. Root351]